MQDLAGCAVTWIVSYYMAAHLVRGVIRPGAPSFCSGQHMPDDCDTHKCVARCTVVAIDKDEWKVQLQEITP